MERASELLKRFLDRNGLSGGEEYISFFQGWSKLAGEDLADHSQLVDVSNGSAIVEVDHPAYMQLLQMRQQKIVSAIQRRHPRLDVKRLNIRLVRGGAKAPADRAARRRRRGEPNAADIAERAGQRAQRDHLGESETANEAVEKLPESRLKDLLGRLKDHLDSDDSR